MRRRRVMMMLAGAVALLAPLAVAGTAEALSAGGWGWAIEVPGSGALNAGGAAFAYSVSCPAAGECAAGGSYADGSGHVQAFVVSELNGRWGRAIEVPGSGALNAGGQAVVYSVSCGSAGNCAAVGDYRAAFDNSRQVFVASEVNGRWGRAIEVPGLGALNAAGNAFGNALSCGSAGNCLAGGSFTDGFGQHAFVVSERNGRWGPPIEVPGSGTLHVYAGSLVYDVSCASAGNCAVIGDYRDGSYRPQAFVVSERNGLWGRAIEVPGLGALNTGGYASGLRVSCSSAGNCAAGGSYTDGSAHVQAFVVSELNGRWGQAIEVPGSGALNAGGSAQVFSVSCSAAANCAAGGNYTDGSGHAQAFIVSEQAGSWGHAIEVPGLAALNAREGAVASLSCGSAGNCVAGGSYTDGSGHVQAFVVSELNGRWGQAIEVPGSGALNAGGYAHIYSVSCPAAGNCAAGGFYVDRSRHSQAFVVSQT